MTAPLDQVDAISSRLVSAVRVMVRDEVEKLRVPAPKVKMLRAEADIMEACRRVAAASDRLAEAKFTSGEPSARVSLEKAAAALHRAMRKHGRVP